METRFIYTYIHIVLLKYKSNTVKAGIYAHTFEKKKRSDRVKQSYNLKNEELRNY